MHCLGQKDSQPLPTLRHKTSTLLRPVATWWILIVRACAHGGFAVYPFHCFHQLCIYALHHPRPEVLRKNAPYGVAAFGRGSKHRNLRVYRPPVQLEGLD